MRNLHVFYLDVQSASSLGDDGQSVCELQAVLSALSQLLGFVIRLFSSLVSEPFIVNSFPGSSWACRIHFGGCSQFCSGASRNSDCFCLDLLCIHLYFSTIFITFCPNSDYIFRQIASLLHDYSCLDCAVCRRASPWFPLQKANGIFPLDFGLLQ